MLNTAEQVSLNTTFTSASVRAGGLAIGSQSGGLGLLGQAAQAQQAGPLAEASARQHVVVEETKVAELEAQREEQRLQASVRKPADAKAYESVTLAKAGRDARIASAEALEKMISVQPCANLCLFCSDLKVIVCSSRRTSGSDWPRPPTCE